MKSIQMKILTLILTSVVAATALITAIALSRSSRILEQDSQNYMNVLCQAETTELNHRLEKIEATTNAIYNFCMANSIGEITPGNVVVPEDRKESVQKMLYATALDTEWCSAAYLRLDPDIFPEEPGIYLVRDPKGDFYNVPPSDIKSNAQKNPELVQWFYAPRREGKPVWTECYVDAVTERQVISYVIPLIYEDEFYGVVGMDVEIGILSEVVQNIHIYETGTASLQAADGTWITDRTQYMEKESGDAGFVTRDMQLRNGMKLHLSVPRAEIGKPRIDMLSDIVIAIFCVVLAVIIVTSYIASRLVRPLQQLTVAAGKVADGYLEVNIDYHSKDEIGTLAASIQQMVQKLRENLQYINHLAYHDMLADTGNKTAYEERITHFDEEIKMGDAAFGLVVMDINDLKKINDTYGHDVGDSLIADAAQVMKKVFGEKAVYRIGGDEFVAVLTRTELLNYQELAAQFLREQEHFNRSSGNRPYHMAIARGVAIFEKGRDLTFADVFRRADHLMYQNKKWIKNQQGN